MLPLFASLLLVATALSASSPPALALDNGACTDDYCGLFDFCYEEEIMQMADAMASVSSGMQDLGYQYINLDDCWGGPRSANGTLTADTSRFPSGSLAKVTSYVHSLGLKMGLYLCAGNETCKYKRPGSWGYFDQDAQTVADWGIDFVKLDWCNHPNLPPPTVYGMMRDSLNKTGRPIVFSACEWGEDEPWTWGMETANMWRVHKDHLPLWGSEQGTANIIQSMAHLSKYAGPGGWNDPDFLMTMLPPLTERESRTEFAFWALFAAPLIVATDIRNMTDVKQSILLNPEVIAINQDAFAIAGDIALNNTDGTQVWTKPLSPSVDNRYAVILYNSNDVGDKNITIPWSILNWGNNAQAEVRDLWARERIGYIKANYTAINVPPRGHMLISITILQ
ncbi:alpha-galactosidase [Capsaspora owczarzaki ATCC 30864]|uniref:Alpha-galactosidase n=1 Tax=Capsaspora owczarzaki (strain ATCC 30864) TaxID=595528 RepID=A0A0D2WUK6_CAPO3|nr:alpha-galactosidase [Capsaspora owczarzaki ATCC 30864]